MSSILRTKKIALVDCNSFYVSCERLFNPRIRRKPVVVLSNNDGCIISRSNEAKALGIKMGEPYFKAKDIIIKNKVEVFSSNYSLYGDLLVVDKSLNPKNFSIVIANIHDELVVKTLVKEKDKQFLTSGSKEFSDRVLINEEQDVFIWGVVTYVIHAVF